MAKPVTLWWICTIGDLILDGMFWDDGIGCGHSMDWGGGNGCGLSIYREATYGDLEGGGVGTGDLNHDGDGISTGEDDPTSWYLYMD